MSCVTKYDFAINIFYLREYEYKFYPDTFVQIISHSDCNRQERHIKYTQIHCITGLSWIIELKQQNNGRSKSFFLILNTSDKVLLIYN